MKSLSAFIMPTLFALLTACGLSPTPPSSGANVHTRVLDASSRALLTSYDPASGTLTFAAGSPAIAALTPGDIVASEPSTAAPYGYLRKVTSVNAGAGVVKLETEQATLEDAVDTGTLNASREITDADLSGPIETMPGVTVSSAVTPQSLGKQADTAKSFNLTFDNLLIDADNNPATTDDQVRVSGSMNVKVRLDLNVDIHKQLGVPTGLDSALAAVTLDEHSQLIFSGQYNGRVSRELSLGSASFNAFTFFIAGVPVTVSPSVGFVLSTDSTVSAKLRLQAVHDFQARIGASYTAVDGWKNLNSLTNDFSAAPPEYAGTMNGRAYAGADFALGFYTKSPSVFGLPEFNLAGASFQAKGRAYAGLDADLKRDPQWKIYAGITADVGMNASVLSRQVANYTARVLDFQRQLSSGNPAVPTQPAPLPAPATFTAEGLTPTDVVLRWSAVPGAVSYLLERRSGSANYSELVRPAAGTTEYGDGGLSPATTYSYRLRAVGANGTGVSIEATGITRAATVLPVIGDPSPANLSLTAPVNGSATATVTYANLGGGTLNADANPGSSWLSVVSNTPRPLAPGATATVNLKATCPATAGVLNTTLIITANDSRIPSKTVNVSLSCVAPLPAIGDPSPSTLDLSATVGASVSGSFTYANTGAGPLSADVNPGSGWLSVTSNTPRPLDPGATATVNLTATCPASAGPLSTTAIVTANDTRIPSKTVTVNLNCTAATVTALGIGVTDVAGQSVPPYGTAANPAVVSGTVTVSGYVQAGTNPVSSVQVLLVGNPYPVGQLTVSVPAGTRQDNVSQANLDTTQLSNGSYSFYVRAVDSTGATSDSSPVTVRVNNVATPPANPSTSSEITQVNSTPISNGRNSTPQALSGTASIFGRLHSGSQGFNGAVHLCLQRGNPNTTGSTNTSVGVQSASMQAGAVYDFGYSWNTTASGSTPADALYDSLFLSGSPRCDDISNPATTSFVQVKVGN